MKKFLIGIDISKEKFDVTVIKSLGEGFESEQVHYDVYDNKVCGYSAMLKKLTSLGVRCEDSLFCLETTGAYELHLCDYLYGKGYDVWRESALQIKWSMGVAKSKNDKADSGRIAQYALRHQDAAVLYAPMNETLRTLKALSLYRERLVDEKRAKEVSIKEIRATQKMNEDLQWVQTNSEQSVKRLEKDIKECEERIMAVIESDEDLKRTYGHITSIKGIGAVNAVLMIVSTGNFKTIPTARKAASYYGIAPFFAQSGSSVHHRKNVSNLSNRRLKGTLTQAAMCAKRFNEDIKVYYERLLAAGKPRRVAINDVRNKLVRIMYALVLNDCDYESKHEEHRTERMSDTPDKKMVHVEPLSA